MDGSALKSAQRKKLHDAKKLPCIDREATHMMNKLQSETNIFNKFLAVVTFLLKLK